MSPDRPEVWLRGPIPNLSPLLQPIAFALLQAHEEVESEMKEFPQDCLWTRPNGVASVGFHLQHLSGVLDRLLTYARQETLNPGQLEYLRQEELAPSPAVSPGELSDRFGRQVETAIDALRQYDDLSLTEFRFVGRNKLPSTVLGLLVHAAEHTQRHVGQLLVTARIQKKSC
jgi:hypothetical protein